MWPRNFTDNARLDSLQSGTSYMPFMPATDLLVLCHMWPGSAELAPNSKHVGQLLGDFGQASRPNLGQMWANADHVWQHLSDLGEFGPESIKLWLAVARF